MDLERQPEADSVAGPMARAREPAPSKEGFETRRMRSALARALFDEDEQQQLGRYQLRQLLGRGGMGSVYEAWDPELARSVALKVFEFSSGTAPSPEAMTSALLDEARSLARFRHDNVVRVYEAGVQGDVAFIAMELVEGAHLGRWATHLPGDPRRRLASIFDAMLQACGALIAIHADAMSHGDFKPANVLVRDDGKVLVADLGLARMTAPTQGMEALTATQDDRSTDPSSRVAGTYEYMAPEQLRGVPASAASDCYAFCLSFAELVLGEVAPPPDERATWVAALPRRAPSRRLGQVLQRGLADRPDDRPASMQALRAELLAAAGPHRGVRLAAFAAALALSGAAFALWALEGQERGRAEALYTDAPLHVEGAE